MEKVVKDGKVAVVIMDNRHWDASLDMRTNPKVIAYLLEIDEYNRGKTFKPEYCRTLKKYSEQVRKIPNEVYNIVKGQYHYGTFVIKWVPEGIPFCITKEHDADEGSWESLQLQTDFEWYVV